MIAPSNPAKPQKACLVTLLQYPYTYQNYGRSLSTFGALRRCACHVASTARRRLPHPQQGYPQPNSNGDHSKGNQKFKQSRLRRVPYMLLCIIRQKMGQRVKKWRVEHWQWAVRGATKNYEWVKKRQRQTFPEGCLGGREARRQKRGRVI